MDRLFEWLALIEDAMTPRMFRDIQDAPPSLNIRHLRDVRDEIRMTAFAFAHLNPPAAERYLSALDPNGVRHNDMQAILRAPGTLPEPRPRRSWILRWARSSRKKTPTTCIAGATDLGRSPYTITCSRQRRRVRVPSSSSWSMRLRTGCA